MVGLFLLAVVDFDGLLVLTLSLRILIAEVVKTKIIVAQPSYHLLQLHHYKHDLILILLLQDPVKLLLMMVLLYIISMNN